MTTSRLIVGPFNRVEGDLEVTLDISDGVVREARVGATLFRGFEMLLRGRAALDALVVAPRICGICSVSQSTAAARLLAAASLAEAPPNGRLAADLVLAAENVADHLTHFVLFFMPDFARACYAGRPWHAAAMRRFAAMEGEASQRLVPARARFLHLMGLLAGKWPHSLALQPGGTTKAVDPAERVRLLSILAEFREVVEKTVFADRLERIATLGSPDALAAWAEEKPAETGDFRLFLHIARDLGLQSMGKGPGLLLSSGSFGLFRPGVWSGAGEPVPFDPATVVEDNASAWLAGPAAHPSAGSTVPSPDKEGAYTWCKAPRLGGRVAEVGALARQAVDGHPLARTLAAEGGSVLARVVARLLEVARLLPAMEEWVKALRPGEPFCAEAAGIADGPAIGLVEAARGTLGHWGTFTGGHIAHYQVVAPTTWNFSPRDAEGRPGALEAALVGTPVLPGETTPVAVQHVVRSFDPCMACTVH
ncbi:MAG: nickel-dependent hydrogenase large subunit [Magnetospirillum sp.]|nr:nickel-dependent hydrogenase large subunit [Magnetospirillum sp.]